MWNILVLSVMVSLSGYYMMANKNGPAVAVMPMSSPYAENMAMYREAVITWFSANKNTKDHRATEAEWKSALPAWSTLGASQLTTFWNNYRAANGIIYVFTDAANPPPVNFNADLLDIAQQSASVAIYKGGKLVSLVKHHEPSAPGVPQPDMLLTPPPAIAGISEGSVVWLASIR